MFAVESAVLWWLWPRGSVGSPGLLLSVDLHCQCVDLTINKCDFYPKNPVDLLCLKIFLFSSNCEKHFCKETTRGVFKIYVRAGSSWCSHAFISIPVSFASGDVPLRLY